MNSEKLRKFFYKLSLYFAITGGVVFASEKLLETHSNKDKIGYTNNLEEYFLKGMAAQGLELEKDERFPNYYKIVRWKTKSENCDKFIMPSEFKELSGIDNITWNDIRQALKNNNNISSDIKDIIKKGFNKLEDKDFDIDLSVLYYNLKDMKIELVDSREEIPQRTAGIYSSKENTIKIANGIDQEYFERVIMHEIGHASIMCEYKKDDKVYCVSSTIPLAYSNDDFSEIYLRRFGDSFNEVYAEIFSCEATDQKIDYLEGYQDLTYYVNMLNYTLGVDRKEYSLNGIESICSRLNALGLVDQNILIEDIDDVFCIASENIAELDKVRNYTARLHTLIVHIGAIINNMGYSLEDVETMIELGKQQNEKYIEFYAPELKAECLRTYEITDNDKVKMIFISKESLDNAIDLALKDLKENVVILKKTN